MLTIDYFKALVPIANPSGQEGTLREYIIQQLHAVGVSDIAVDEAGNVLARVMGNPQKAPFLFSAHMDSVPPCSGIEPVADEINNRPVIRSTGKTILGADDKSGIAVMLALAARLAQSGSSDHHPLELLFSTQEEVGLLGLKAFDLSQCQARLGFVLDGEGDVGEIFYAGPSQQNLLFQLEGLASHAGIAPEAGVNAIEMAVHLCASLPSGRISPDTTMNIGTIQGGNALNIVAPSAVVRGELRSHEAKALEAMLAQIQEVCQEVQESFPRGKITFIPNHRYTRFEVPKDAPVVRIAQDACTRTGVTPRLARMNIGSDAHVLNHGGIPTVVLGMGFHYSHSLGEFIYVDELEQVSQWVWEIVQH